MPPIFKRDPRFKQGIFKPKNPKKFLSERAIYRSSYELRFFRWADENPNVLEWSSESIIIPYISPIDGKGHRYYVDNYCVLKEGDIIKRYLVEIKPSSQIQKPKVTKTKKPASLLYEQTQWVVNQAKWEAAGIYAKKRGFEFIILTEKELFPKTK